MNFIFQKCNSNLKEPIIPFTRQLIRDFLKETHQGFDLETEMNGIKPLFTKFVKKYGNVRFDRCFYIYKDDGWHKDNHDLDLFRNEFIHQYNRFCDAKNKKKEMIAQEVNQLTKRYKYLKRNLSSNKGAQKEANKLYEIVKEYYDEGWLDSETLNSFDRSCLLDFNDRSADRIKRIKVLRLIDEIEEFSYSDYLKMLMRH